MRRARNQPITMEWVLANCAEDELRGCLVWQLSVQTANGHPVARAPDLSTVNVKRLVLGVTRKPGMVAVHVCGNARCLKRDKEHLIAIPKNEHARWLNQMGRRQPGYMQALKAAKSGAFKINLGIARQWRTDGRPAYQIAKEAGVSASCVERVLNGTTWKDPLFAGLGA